MENCSGLLPYLWKTFKKPQQERKPVALPLHHIPEDRVEHEDDVEYFLHPELERKSPARFAKSPSCMFGMSPGRAPGQGHKRRHSISGLGGSFSLPKLLSSHSQRAR